MTICKGFSVAVLLMLGGFLAAQASAAEPGGYFGVSVGQSMTDLDPGEIDSALASMGVGATTTVDDKDIGFKMFGGYQFTRNLGVEVAYSNLGKFTSHTVVTSGGSGTGNGEWSGYSLDASALGILPLGEKSALFARAGVSIWSLDCDFAVTGPGGTAGISESETGVSPLLGLGASFDLTEKVSLRAEFERRFAVGDEDTTGQGDIDLLSVGVVFRF